MSIYELRTYHAAPGKIGALHARFSDHTNALFKRHGLEALGYWTDEARPDVLVYLLRFPDAAAMKASWDAFRADPAWQHAKAESEKDGALVAKIESVTMSATPYSTFLR